MSLAPSFPVPVQTDVPLAGLTTLGVGGPARYYAEVRDVASLVALLKAARELPVYFVGEGSNLLVADAGFDGLVVRYLEDSLTVQGDLVTVGAGMVWDRLVERSVQQGWAGLECLSGIPGLVGAAPIQNIGAYGQEVAEVLHAVHVVDRATGETRRFAREECGFGYRTSHFKAAWRDRYVITHVELALRPGAPGTVRYADLKKRFEALSAPPNLVELRGHVLEIRRTKSMVYDPADANHRSAGSFFVNPVVSSAQAERVRELADHPGPMPAYPAGEGQVKLSAAWLMERAGFQRGYVRGRAGLSSNHVLALINRGGATAAEILELAAEIRERVQSRFGVELHQEPNLLGF